MLCKLVSGSCEAQNANQRGPTTHSNGMAALLARAMGLVPRLLLTKDSFKRGRSNRLSLRSDKISLHSRMASHDRISGHGVRKRGYHRPAVISADRPGQEECVSVPGNVPGRGQSLGSVPTRRCARSPLENDADKSNQFWMKTQNLLQKSKRDNKDNCQTKQHSYVGSFYLKVHIFIHT